MLIPIGSDAAVVFEFWRKFKDNAWRLLVFTDGVVG